MFNKRLVIKKRQPLTITNSVIVIILIIIFSIGKDLLVSLTFRQTKIDPYYSIARNLFSNYDLMFDYTIIEKLKKANFDNCPLCLMKKNSTSTPKDITVTFLFGTCITNVVTWVRMLRSTGFLGKILFLVERGYKENFNENEIKTLEQCGVVLWEIGYFRATDGRSDLRPFRYFPIQSFLEAYGNLFDRVLINDIFDSVFQKDPFVPSLPSDKVAASVEKVQFQYHDTNMNWVRAIDKNFTTEFWNRKFCINGGFVLGKPDLILELFFYMHYPKLLFAPGTSDQGTMNYVHYRNLFKKMWIDKKAEFFSSACYSKYQLKPGPDGYMHEQVSPQLTPHIIHQFDRIEPVINYLKSVCPALGDWHREPYGRMDHIVQNAEGVSYTNNVPILPE